MSKALESAKLALERWRGDSNVPTADVLKEMAVAIKIRAGGAREVDSNDRPH